MLWLAKAVESYNVADRFAYFVPNRYMYLPIRYPSIDWYREVNISFWLYSPSYLIDSRTYYDIYMMIVYWNLYLILNEVFAVKKLEIDKSTCSVIVEFSKQQYQQSDNSCIFIDTSV